MQAANHNSYMNCRFTWRNEYGGLQNCSTHYCQHEARLVADRGKTQWVMWCSVIHICSFIWFRVFQDTHCGVETMAEDPVLDTAIRDWVLIPLLVVMVLIGVLRYFISKLLRSSQVPDSKIVKEGQVIVRARNLRAAVNYTLVKSFHARKIYFNNEEKGFLHVPKGQAQNAQAHMFSDPNMAMDMMKKNLSMIIPQTLYFCLG